MWSLVRGIYADQDQIGMIMDRIKLNLLQIGNFFLKLYFVSLLLNLCMYIYFKVIQEIPWHLPARLMIVEFLTFLAGIFLVYLTSSQLGIKPRVFALLFGLVPIVNLYVIFMIVGISGREIQLEKTRGIRDAERVSTQICATKYPILLVHGVFFRDSKHINYWGRIPKDLIDNGARIFYGEHNSAASVDQSAKELGTRVDQILAETGCEKINIIAHSKGGLDARACVADGNAHKIASLTTINTPHRGCEFADYYLNKIPKETQVKIAEKYNLAARAMGDKNPDLIAAVTDLTAHSCKMRNETIKNDPDVFYQSVGSVLKSAASGSFPMNLTHGIVKMFDGENDGLVGVDSFPWGERYILLRNHKSRSGISHADMIDLDRANIKGFDVREFYVQLVAELKNKGF